MIRQIRAISLAAVSTKAQTEGVSLEKQVADNESASIKLNALIIDTLIIDGHSRWFSSFQDAAEAMRSRGIDAFDRLIAHMKSKDFDLLICRDGNRFGRKQGLFAQIVEMVIEADARIYCTLDGYMVDQHNYTMYIAMSGYRAAAEINENVKKQSDGRKARVQRGLPEHRAPAYLLPVRESRKGRSVNYQHDPAWQPVWDALKIELLKGTNWREIDYAVSNPPYSLVSPATGKPFTANKLRAMVYTPLFWGHVASGHRLAEVDTTDPDHNSWIFDDRYLPPEGVTVDRHVFPAVYQGDDAALVIAELHRRQRLKGNSRPYRAHMFAGLCYCARCGYAMATHVPTAHGKHWHRTIRCSSRFKSNTRAVCDNKASIRYDVIQQSVSILLHNWLNNTSNEFQPDVRTTLLPGLQTQQMKLQARINALIRTQSELPEDAPRTIRQAYQAEMLKLGSEMDELAHRVRRAEQEEAHWQTQQARQQQAAERLRALPLETLWSLPENEINQILHSVFDTWKLIIEDGEIIKVAQVTGSRWSGAKHISM